MKNDEVLFFLAFFANTKFNEKARSTFRLRRYHLQAKISVVLPKSTSRFVVCVLFWRRKDFIVFHQSSNTVPSVTFKCLMKPIAKVINCCISPMQTLTAFIDIIVVLILLIILLVDTTDLFIIEQY